MVKGATNSNTIILTSEDHLAFVPVEDRCAKRLDTMDVSSTEVPNDLLGEVQNGILTVVQVRVISSILLEAL